MTRWAALAGSIVASAALFAHAPVISNSFVNRDELTLFGVGPVREGRFQEMLVPRRDFAGYMPAGYLLFSAVFHAGGARLAPFRLTALVIHAANSVLLFLVILLLLRKAGGDGTSREPERLACAGLAAVFFAVHPIHAESLSVAANLGDLAAAFLGVAAVLCYLRAKTGAASSERRLMAASLGLALLSGLTRWTAVSLPAILLILDAYPLRRLGRAALVEKVPYLLISLLVTAANMYGKMGPAVAGAAQRVDLHPGGIAAGLIFYVWKWLVPGEFALYYVLDHPVDLMGIPVWACFALVAAAVAALIAARRRAPAALAAFAVHAVAVAPVLLTTTNTYVQAHNRYAYISGMALAAAGAGGLLAARRLGGALPALLPGAVVAMASVFFGAQARGQAADWHDNARLESATLSTAPDEFFSFFTVGEAMLRRKEYALALQQFSDQVNDHPDDARARRRLQEVEAILFALELNSRGTAAAAAGDTAAAIANFNWALFLRPDMPLLHRNLAGALRREGRRAEAEAHDKKAASLEAAERAGAAGPAGPR